MFLCTYVPVDLYSITVIEIVLKCADSIVLSIFRCKVIYFLLLLNIENSWNLKFETQDVHHKFFIEIFYNCKNFLRTHSVKKDLQNFHQFLNVNLQNFVK